jgi:hypothetical protein
MLHYFSRLSLHVGNDTANPWMTEPIPAKFHVKPFAAALQHLLLATVSRETLR